MPLLRATPAGDHIWWIDILFFIGFLSSFLLEKLANAPAAGGNGTSVANPGDFGPAPGSAAFFPPCFVQTCLLCIGLLWFMLVSALGSCPPRFVLCFGSFSGLFWFLPGRRRVVRVRAARLC